MHIGDRISAARKSKGFSQQQLGDAVNQAQTTISSWERGRTEPSRADVEKVAHALGIASSSLEPEQVELGNSNIRVIGRIGDTTSGKISPVFDLWAPSLPGAPADAMIVESTTQLREFAEEGTLLYFGFMSQEPADTAIDALALVHLRGEDLPRVARLVRGSEIGKYDLAPFIGPRIRDADIAWAAEMIGHISARQAQRVLVRGAHNAA